MFNPLAAKAKFNKLCCFKKTISKNSNKINIFFFLVFFLLLVFSFKPSSVLFELSVNKNKISKTNNNKLIENLLMFQIINEFNMIQSYMLIYFYNEHRLAQPLMDKKERDK